MTFETRSRVQNNFYTRTSLEGLRRSGHRRILILGAFKKEPYQKTGKILAKKILTFSTSGVSWFHLNKEQILD